MQIQTVPITFFITLTLKNIHQTRSHKAMYIIVNLYNSDLLIPV